MLIAIPTAGPRAQDVHCTTQIKCGFAYWKTHTPDVSYTRPKTSSLYVKIFKFYLNTFKTDGVITRTLDILSDI